MRRMFADIDADVYVMVDGDSTYDAGAAPDMVQMLIAENVDMVVGGPATGDEAFRRGHVLGNGSSAGCTRFSSGARSATSSRVTGRCPGGW